MPTDAAILKMSFIFGIVLGPTMALAQNPGAKSASSADSLANTPPSASADPANQAAMPESRNAPPPDNPDPNMQSQPTTVFSGMMDPFDYDPRGRRDPFGQPIADKPMSQGGQHGPMLPLQKFELNQLRLTGIMWDVRQPKAIFKDPSGAIYIVGPNAKIGPRNGYVAVIREGEIVVVETVDEEGKLISTAQVVKIAK